MKKITLATIKSFIRKNKSNLFLNVKSSFDGMTDCIEFRNYGFNPIKNTEWAQNNHKHTMGIQGAWFVGQSRDYFSEYSKNGFFGYEVSNCCGSFVLAVKN